jgi:hypothetical protein
MCSVIQCAVTSDDFDGPVVGTRGDTAATIWANARAFTAAFLILT